MIEQALWVVFGFMTGALCSTLTVLLVRALESEK